MELKISLNKGVCTDREIALVIWQNMILAKELEFIYQTIMIGTEVIKPKEVNIEYITKVVCEYFRTPIELVKSNTRKREIAQTRQIAMYFSRHLTKNSLSEIGNEFYKDHATVIHADKTVTNLYETDRRYRSYIDDLERILKSAKKLILS